MSSEYSEYFPVISLTFSSKRKDCATRINLNYNDFVSFVQLDLFMQQLEQTEVVMRIFIEFTGFTAFSGYVARDNHAVCI